MIIRLVSVLILMFNFTSLSLVTFNILVIQVDFCRGNVVVAME